MPLTMGYAHKEQVQRTSEAEAGIPYNTAYSASQVEFCRALDLATTYRGYCGLCSYTPGQREASLQSPLNSQTTQHVYSWVV